MFECRLLLFFMMLLNVQMLFSEDEKQREYIYLDGLALKAGTDKSSQSHHYTKAYAQYFSPLKEKPIKFLEIGIGEGSSVKLWENYFPNAELHFIDIGSTYIKYFSERSHYHFIDQTNAMGLKTFGDQTGLFDIIIDDGGHSMMQQLVSFQTLFPYVKPGGLYVIEDLHTSYWSYLYGGSGILGKSGPGTTVGFLQSLVDELNYVGAATGCADAKKAPITIMNYYREHIDSIHFYSSLCIIEKK